MSMTMDEGEKKTNINEFLERFEHKTISRDVMQQKHQPS